MWTVLGVALLVVAASPARPSSKTNSVQVGKLGALRGQEMTLARTQRATAFLGISYYMVTAPGSDRIPYAKAPIGSLRFKKPQTDPWPQWDGTRDATSFRPSCKQPLNMRENGDKLGLMEKLQKPIEYSEDCLYLNIYVPDGKPPPGDWSVIIWFHPGDFSVGSPSIWDGSTLAIKQKVIVVTASYRLNIFGFMSAIDKETPGNLGLLDQIAVMDWVQEHIKYFNGSKYDVTLWGHSAGAVSISLHLLTELSSGKFHKAILMSGNFISSKPVKDPLSIADIAEQVNCGKDSIKITLEECLQNVDTDDLLTIAESHSWGPVIPDHNKNLMPAYLTQNPEMLLMERDSVVNSVPIMMGYTNLEDVPVIDIKSDMEFQEIIKSMIEGQEMIQNLNSNADNETCNDDLLTESVLFHYSPSQILEDKKMYFNNYLKLVIEKKYGATTFQLGKYTSKKNATYIYRFDYKLKTVGLGETKEYPGVPQQHELPFFWGMPYWATLSPQITWNSQDKRTSDVVMGFLGNFTKYSRPVESKRNMQWDALDVSNPNIFIIDKIPNMSDSETFDYKSLSFWNDYYPKLRNKVEHCCSLINTASCFSPIKALLIIIIINIFIFDEYRIFFYNCT